MMFATFGKPLSANNKTSLHLFLDRLMVVSIYAVTGITRIEGALQC